MPKIEEIKAKIGADSYAHIEKLADSEVGEAMAMELIDKYRKERYYRRKPLIKELLIQNYAFEEKGLKISPYDILSVLFHYKLLFACSTEQEFIQRTGGGLIFNRDSAFNFGWSEKQSPPDDVLNRHLELLEASISESTLVSRITQFRSDMGDPRAFFEEIFAELNLPFSCFLEDAALEARYKEMQPGLRTYTLEMARRYFSSPSIGFTATGTDNYVHLYASAQLRAFLNFLRIAGFIYNGQIDFGFGGVTMEAPTTPVFLGTNSFGVFAWNEDAKEPWAKFPDGCLFRSFGYRGLSHMWLDTRTFGGIKKFFTENKIIFELLKNPWSKENLHDIAPALDILSSATQISDLGAKTLLLYCCLEHLFVPKSTKDDNVKYIVGAIHALNPDLLPWFDRLYKVRCQYAHRGFIVADQGTTSLIFESVRNVVQLMTSKLTLI